MRLGLLLLLSSMVPAMAAKAEKPKADPAMRERVAVLVLRRAAFGAHSFLPVSFSKSRLAGPFEDDGQTTFCVATHMSGRSFGKDERPRAIVRMKADG